MENNTLPSEDGVIIVFTAKSIERMLTEGGTCSWRLDPGHARQRKYVICTRNANHPETEGLEPHRSAFLIGEISSVVPTNDPTASGRFLIRFARYAKIDIPGFWDGARNPVKYATLQDYKIDLNDLTWLPVATLYKEREEAPGLRDVAGGIPPAPPASSGLKTPAAIKSLTLAEAKQGLALTFGVSADAIEITVRG